MLLWEKVVASRLPRMARVQGHTNCLTSTPHPTPSWAGRTLGSASLTQSQASGPQIAAQVTCSSFKLLTGVRIRPRGADSNFYFLQFPYSVNFSLPWLCQTCAPGTFPMADYTLRDAWQSF